MADWHEHYKRLKRARTHLNTEWNNGEEDADKMERVRDAFFDFFQSCFHLVDWLENDPSQPIRRSEAETFVMGSPALSLCLALCHGSKHATLKQKGITAVRPERQVISELPFVDGNRKKLGAIQFSALGVSIPMEAAL